MSILHLLQYGIFYFAALLGFIDFDLAGQLDMAAPFGRAFLMALSIILVLATSVVMCRSIYKTAKELSAHIDDKVIVDVLNDLHKQ